MSKFKVLMAGLAVVVLWASAFPAIRVAAPDLGVIGLSVVRLAVASLALLAVAPLAHVRRPERRHLPLVVAAAFFGMTAYQLLLNAAELHVPAATASIVVAAAPLVSVAIATLFLGEQLTVTRVAGSVVAIGGVVAVSLARSGATVTSALLIVVGAAVVQGIYHPLIKPLLRDRSGLEVATYTMLAGTIMSLPLLPWGWHDMVAASGVRMGLGALPRPAALRARVRAVGIRRGEPADGDFDLAAVPRAGVRRPDRVRLAGRGAARRRAARRRCRDRRCRARQPGRSHPGPGTSGGRRAARACSTRSMTAARVAKRLARP